MFYNHTSLCQNQKGIDFQAEEEFDKGLLVVFFS